MDVSHRNRISAIIDQVEDSPTFRKLAEEAIVNHKKTVEQRRAEGAAELAAADEWFADQEPRLLSAIDHASEALKTSREDYDAAHAAFKDAHGRLTWARLELDRRRAMARRKLVSSRPAAIGEFLTWLSEAEQEAKNGLRTWTATSGLLARLTGRPRLVDQSNSEKVDAKLAAICEARDWCQRHVENEFLPLAELEDKLEIFRRDIERMTV